MVDPALGWPIIQSNFVPPGSVLLIDPRQLRMPSSFPLTLPNMFKRKATKPDVRYRYRIGLRKWQFRIENESNWSTSYQLGESQCITPQQLRHIREEWPQRDVVFESDPECAGQLAAPLRFAALGEREREPVKSEPAEAAGSPDKVTYRFNTVLQNWEFTWPGVTQWYQSDYLNHDTKSDPYVLSEQQLQTLKKEWPNVTVLPPSPAVTLYRYALGRWEFYSRKRGWVRSVGFANWNAVRGVEYIIRDHNTVEPGRSGNLVITTMFGMRFSEWQAQERLKSEQHKQVIDFAQRQRDRVDAAIFGELSGPAVSGRVNNPYAPMGSLSYPDIGRVSGRLIASPRELAKAYGASEQQATIAQAVADRFDSVLMATERQRFNRVHVLKLPAIPFYREWLNGSGDLIDLKTVDNDHLRNIVNMVMRGARVNGQKIERTQERVRQGLNAAAEQAERVERFEYAKVKAEVGEKAVRNEALSFLNSLQSLKRLVDPSATPQTAKVAK